MAMKNLRDVSGVVMERIRRNAEFRSMDGVTIRGDGVPTEYFIDESELRSHADITRWSLHLLSKRWVTADIIRNFIEDADWLVGSRGIRR